MPVRKILVPIDYSERSRIAMDYALHVAEALDGQVIVLHVIADTRSEARWPAQRELETSLPDELCTNKTRAVILAGDPAECILEFAAAEKVDLIVMGTHGYGPLGRAVHGSVTTAVLDRADCPVLTGVRLEPRDDTFHMDRVVCSVNACVESQVPGWASRIATAFHANLYLDAGCDGHCGMTPEDVCGHAEALKADLLVIGRKHPHGRWAQHEEDAGAIIREAPCAVLSV